jgi:hypothetical protein
MLRANSTLVNWQDNVLLCRAVDAALDWRLELMFERDHGYRFNDRRRVT